MVEFADLRQTFTDASNVLLSLHLISDGDSLGSCLALKTILETHFGCTVTIVTADPIGEQLARFPGAETVLQKDIADVDLTAFDTLVYTDCSELSRISHHDFALPEHLSLAAIDHHVKTAVFDGPHIIDTSAASTCSVLLRMCSAWSIPLEPTLATQLILGVSTDSAFFTVLSTSAMALQEAGTLVEGGADYRLVLETLHSSMPLRLKQYRARVIENLEVVGSFGISTITLDEINTMGITEGEIRSATGTINGISECEACCLLTETEGGIKGSFRSIPDVDVAALAQQLGGGGHKNAAGFVIENATLEEAKQKVLSVVEQSIISS